MIRTPQQFLESLNDGRVIYYKGEQIKNIKEHPMLGWYINARTICYELCNHPKFKDLLTIEEDGDRYLFLWKQPKTSEDLLRRRDLYITCLRMNARKTGAGPDALRT